jgi:hypothetical protein
MIDEEISTFGCYEYAIARLATVVPRAGGDKSRVSAPLLVFASLEFLTTDRPVPDTTPLDRDDVPPHIRSGSSGSTIYFRRIAMTAGDALSWYKAAADGKLAPPRAACKRDRGRHDEKPLRAPNLTEEPPWPGLAFPVEGQALFGGEAYYPTPFIGASASPARIHRLMAAADPDLIAFAEDEDACAWLAPRVHCRLDDYPELLGSIALVAPDPQVRSIRQYLTHKDGKESFVTAIRPRFGRSLEGLELTILEERFGAISTFVRKEVPPHGIVVTSAPDKIRTSGYMLAHPERGLIGFQSPLPFVRTVGLTTELLSRRVRIQTRDSKKKDAETKTHDIAEFAGSQSLVGDQTPPLDAHSRYFDGVEHRKVARLGEQRWFDNPASARAFVRSLIGRARTEVFVADAFFGPEELAAYLHFVHRLGIKLKLLTSSKALGSGADRAVSARQLHEVIAGFHARGLKDVQVRIMRNTEGEPLLHDRFLVVDGAVWFSGNSFNAIGHRESLLVRVPDPAPVILRLQTIFEEGADALSAGADSSQATQSA